MARVINFLKVLRSNWKKSVVGTAALSYGVSYSINYYDTERLMTKYCKEAVKYGDAPLPTNVKPRHITVILNPAANKRKAKRQFEKYCEPLLHLAGIAVTIVQTEGEGQARNLVANLQTQTDAIVVAGGDGTLLDVITGVIRKYDGDLMPVKNCPIGILPLGKTNKMANSLFHGYEDLPDIREMAEATMAVVRGHTKMVDSIKIEALEHDIDEPIKPVYTVGALEWGAWRDAKARTDKYWYWGSLRRYVTYIFSGYKEDLNWDCSATLRYSDPCSGCSRCYQQRQTSSQSSSSGKRWWSVFVPKINTYGTDYADYSKVINEECGTLHEIPITASDLYITTTNSDNAIEPQTIPAIKINLGPKDVNYTRFVAEGWKREKGSKSIEKTLEAKDIELIPKSLTDNEKDKSRMISIDDEEFELRPIKMRLFPKSVKIFCP